MHDSGPRAAESAPSCTLASSSSFTVPDKRSEKREMQRAQPMLVLAPQFDAGFWIRLVQILNLPREFF